MTIDRDSLDVFLLSVNSDFCFCNDGDFDTKVFFRCRYLMAFEHHLRSQKKIGKPSLL